MRATGGCLRTPPDPNPTGPTTGEILADVHSPEISLAVRFRRGAHIFDEPIHAIGVRGNSDLECQGMLAAGTRNQYGDRAGAGHELFVAHNHLPHADPVELRGELASLGDRTRAMGNELNSSQQLSALSIGDAREQDLP